MTSLGGRVGIVALISVFAIACGGTVPSATPSPVTPTNSPSAGPTSTPDSSPTSSAPSSSPSADPTGTPVLQEGWVQLAAASNGSATWSPDAAHILVELVEPGEPPESQQVQLMARDGQLVRTYQQVAQPVWLDEERFVGYRLDWRQDEAGDWYSATGPNGERLGTAMVGSVGSDVLEEIDIPLGHAESNGHGALAIESVTAPIPNTAVWADSVLSESHSGAPLSWSPSGDQLVLIHDVTSGGFGEGWPEVVAWPGLTATWSDESKVVSEAYFDPTGALLAYPEFVPRPRVPRQVPEFDLILNVVDLATGTTSPVTAPENGDFAWLSDDRLLTVGFESSQASVLGLSGEVLAQESVVGPNVIVSADGLTALFYDAELDEPPMQILRGDELTLLDSPGLMTGQAPQLSRDGSGVLVVVRAATDSPTGAPATVLVHYL